MAQKNEKVRIYECEKCKFETCKKTDFMRHLSSKKHLKNEKNENDDIDAHVLELRMRLEMAEKIAEKDKQLIELQTNFINVFAGTINKKAPKIPVMDISGNVVSDEEQEPEPEPEPKLKKEPDWIPEHTFNEINQHYDSQFTYPLIDQYKKYDELLEKDIKDYETYIEEELGDKDEQTKFMNEFTCDSFQFTLFKDCMTMALSNKVTVPCFDEQLRKFLKIKLSQEKIIKVLDANRAKFYIYGENQNKKKWLDTHDSYQLLKDFINDIHIECIHQGSVFNHLYKNHPEFDKVLNAYNFHDKVETFINKLLKEL